MPKRHRLAALVAASLALGSVGLTAAVAGADGPGHDQQRDRDRTEHDDDSGGAHQPHRSADLNRLAIEQTKLWATYEATPEAIAAKVSPASCNAARTVSNVFLLPVNRASGDPTTAATVCTVRSKQAILLDLGGFVDSEDAAGVAGGVELDLDGDGAIDEATEVFAFTPENLQLISRYFLDNGLVPLPTDVTLDGRPVEGIEGIVTENFRFKPVPGTDYATAAAALGHPGYLTMNYVGYKALLPPLSKGRHVLQATVLGNHTITWTVDVVR